VQSLRVVRPYTTEEEFLDAEAYTLNSRSVLLIDISPYPEGETVRVELTLRTGKPLILAEGAVVKHLAKSTTRPAGLVVRFRRMSGASSEFLKRAVARNAERPQSSSPLASTPLTLEHPSLVERESENAHSKPRSVTSPEAPSFSMLPPESTRNVQRTVSPSVTQSNLTSCPNPSTPTLEPRAQRTSVPPTDRRVSSRPTPPPRSVPAPLETTRPKALIPSVPTQTSTEASHSTTTKVLPETAHHDTDAMERLRRRDVNKPITVPPNREAILARLKKPS
jgi:hypothetical protein